MLATARRRSLALVEQVLCCPTHKEKVGFAQEDVLKLPAFLLLGFPKGPGLGYVPFSASWLKFWSLHYPRKTTAEPLGRLSDSTGRMAQLTSVLAIPSKLAMLHTSRSCAQACTTHDHLQRPRILLRFLGSLRGCSRTTAIPLGLQLEELFPVQLHRKLGPDTKNQLPRRQLSPQLAQNHVQQRAAMHLVQSPPLEPTWGVPQSPAWEGHSSSSVFP